MKIAVLFNTSSSFLRIGGIHMLSVLFDLLGISANRHTILPGRLAGSKARSCPEPVVPPPVVATT